MGRYPLRAAVNAYIEAHEEYLAQETLTERRRKLMALAKRYEELCIDNPSLEKDPRRWSEKEVTTIVLETKKHGWSLETQAKELGNTRALLRFLGNGALDKLRAGKPYMFPKRIPSRGPSLTEDELARVLRASEGMQGWIGEAGRMVVATLAYTGLRPGELGKAEIDDLDLSNWTLRVSHPKGEASYGRYRVVPIPAPLRPVVTGYLRAREHMLAENGVLDAKPLICSCQRPGKPYTSKHMRSLKRKICRCSGVQFELRALRRTYGQQLLNRNVAIETVSLALGHTSTRTTETYYCRKDADTARLEILRAFEGSAKGPSAENPEIESKAQLTGYA